MLIVTTIHPKYLLLVYIASEVSFDCKTTVPKSSNIHFSLAGYQNIKFNNSTISYHHHDMPVLINIITYFFNFVLDGEF